MTRYEMLETIRSTHAHHSSAITLPCGRQLKILSPILVLSYCVRCCTSLCWIALASAHNFSGQAHSAEQACKVIVHKCQSLCIYIPVPYCTKTDNLVPCICRTSSSDRCRSMLSEACLRKRTRKVSKCLRKDSKAVWCKWFRMLVTMSQSRR